MKYPLSIRTLAQGTAFVGKTGSGKTTSAKGGIEEVLSQDEHARVSILDPTKHDWWGLTSSASGKRPGFPFQILGGPHGHVPLHHTAGKVVGELVGRGELPLSIIDMAHFPMGGLQHFFADFSEALMRSMRGVLYLVLEEAHEFAPKERSGIGNENMAVYWAKKLATAGRSRGIRLMVVTQRTQKLHNDLLGSCETLVAHKLKAPADQKPVKDWLKDNCDADTFERVTSTLGKLKTGTAWVCSDEAVATEPTAFPPLRTFDNTKTPDSADGKHHVTTAPVDRARLTTIMGDAVKEAEANDLPTLKKRIRELEGELAKKPAPKTETVTVNAKAEQIEAAFKRGVKAAELSDRMQARDLHRVVGHATAKVDTFINHLTDFRDTMKSISEELAKVPAPVVDSAPIPVLKTVATSPGVTHAREPFTPTPSPAKPGPVTDGLTGPMQRILDALAELAALGIREASRVQVVFLSGYGHPNSKGFVNAIGALSTGGYVTYPRGGVVALTETGTAAANHAGAPLTSADLQRRVLDLLGNAHGRILQPLIDAYPGQLSRQELCAAAGYGHMNSKGFVNAIGRLRTLGFIDYPSSGQVVALPVLFVE